MKHLNPHSPSRTPQARRRRSAWRASALVAACLSASGCATTGSGGAKSGDAAKPLPHEALKDSAVDISYVLGHSRRRLVAWARNESFGGQALLDHQILRESEVDRSRYSAFFGKAEALVSAPKRKPAQQGAAGSGADDNDSCRTPFTVTVRVGSKSQTLQGCRGEDDGALSHLVREGEFLLYSSK
jgi:hypothetical protein